MLFGAMIALLITVASLASAQDVVKDRAECYTTWDQAYIYLAFKVDSPDVQAAHKMPNADVSGDDSVTVYVDTDSSRTSKLTPGCFSMAVSAAGGAQFQVGETGGVLKPVVARSFKYGATIQGTVNNADDIDTSYMIEIALPWELLQTKAPELGTMMGFNVVIRRHGAKPGEFVSLSPSVKTETDIQDPSKWVNLVYAAYAFVATSPGSDKIVSTKSMVRPPLINGLVDSREWPKNTFFGLDLPMPKGFIYEAKYPTQRLVLTRYQYDYQCDPRKSAPFTKLTASDGGPAVQDFPAKNLGPWLSYDRVQTHKDQLNDMVAAGVDVVLPVYRGDKASRSTYAAKGLDCIVSAIEELEQEGKSYPLIGLYLDTDSIRAAYGSKPDLRNEEVKRSLYGVIKDFFDRVPVEYRAFAQTGKPEPGRPASIVVMDSAQAFSAVDPAFAAYCSDQFQKDCGSSLAFVLSSDFKTPCDGVCYPNAGLGMQCDLGSRIKIASIGPGFDSCGLASANAQKIRARMGGEAYDKDWADAIAKQPNWILCDSWNDLANGSDIFASRQYGRKFIDATRANVDRFQAKLDYDAQYLRWNVPKAIAPKQFVQAEVTLRNVGNSPWRVSDGCAISYRWYHSGRYFGESKVRRPLQEDVLPGQTVSLPIGIATVTAQGESIPEGRYELSFSMMRLTDNKWFSQMGDQPLTVPLTIGAQPEWSASYLACDAPAMVASGQTYQVSLRVRNDGSQTWRKGVTKLSCQLYKHSNYTHDNQAQLDELVPTKEMRALLTTDCKPGESTTIAIEVNLAQPDKKPVAAWNPEIGWSYQLCFDLFNGKQWLSEVGVQQLARTVDVFDSDYGARIADCNLPAKLTAGQTVDARVVVRNGGVETWSRKRVKLGYHWYHLDGSLLKWDGLTSAIPADIKPGLPAMLQAKVQAPDADGQYVLVWDVMVDNTWLSTLPLTRGGDILPVFVEVTGGKLAFVDLSAMCDASAFSPNTNTSSGDFDGKGDSFPAEYMPPDAGVGQENSRIYPSGYNWIQPAEASERISFSYPEKALGAKNAITCSGQKVIVTQEKYKTLNIVAASIKGDAAGDLSLNYSDGADAAKITVSDWGVGPKHGEAIAAAARHRHNHVGDIPGARCYLYHCTVPLNAARTLTSVTLPKNPSIKVLAVTLERP